MNLSDKFNNENPNPLSNGENKKKIKCQLIVKLHINLKDFHTQPQHLIISAVMISIARKFQFQHYIIRFPVESMIKKQQFQTR